MKVPIPSPAMAVALLALVVATTGTAVAAKSAMISGSDIKPHSITAKQLKKGAVDAKALRKGAVRNAALAPGSVSPAKLSGPLPPSVVSQTCPDGTVVVGTPCPVGTFGDVAGGAVSNEASIPAAANSVTFYHAGQQGSASLTPKWARTPLSPTRVSKLTAEISIDPAVKWPKVVIVQLLAQGKATAVGCAINQPVPGGANTCSMTPNQAIDIPGLTRYTFAIFVSGAAAGDPDPSWDAFSVGFGYISAQTCRIDPCP